MDHLPIPTGVVLPAIHVPFICDDEPICTVVEFFQWDALQKVALQSNLPTTIVARRLQSWMYFGLLSAYLLIDMPREKFLRESSNGSKVIDSNKVRSALAAYNSRTKEVKGDHTSADFESHLNSLRRWVLRRAKYNVNEVIVPLLIEIDQDKGEDLWSSEVAAVAFSIDVLIDLLYSRPLEGETFVYPPLIRSYYQQRRSMAAEVPQVRRSILKSGRCPSLGWRLEPTSTIWYRLLYMPGEKVIMDHRRCSITRCALNDVDVKNYETQHRTSCRGCQFLHSDQEVLIDSISHGRIPLVKYSKDIFGNSSLKTVNGSIQSSYVAISHVWTGGLGNLKNNAIPTCQLEHLAMIVNDRFPSVESERVIQWAPDIIKNIGTRAADTMNRILGPPSTLFYLDTLCVPVEPELRQYRKDTIDSMAQIYAGATAVLVLDPQLQELEEAQISSEKMGDNDHPLSLHLAVSPWRARAWPYQESTVALSVYACLKDKLIGLKVNSFEGSSFPGLSGGQAWNPNPFVDPQAEWLESPKFELIWNEMVTRSTTQPEDTYAIFASLLDLNVKEVLSLPKNERMRALIKAQKAIPITMLYSSYEYDGVHDSDYPPWIPFSMDQIPSGGYLSGHYGSLTLKQNGFRIEFVEDTVALEFNSDVSVTDNFVLWHENSTGERQRNYVQLAGRRHGRGFKPEKGFLALLCRERREGKLGFRGALFFITHRDEERMALQYDTAFHWSPTIPSHLINGIECQRSYELFDEEYEIVLEQDSQSWYTVRWSRTSIFSYQERYYSSLRIWILSTGFCSVLFGSTITFLIDASVRTELDFNYFRRGVKVMRKLLPLVPMFILRIALFFAEFQLWCRSLTQFARQRWAATFHDSQIARELLRNIEPSLTMRLSTCYLNLAFGGIAMIGWFITQESSILGFAVYSFTEPIISAVFELVLRNCHVYIRFDFWVIFYELYGLIWLNAWPLINYSRFTGSRRALWIGYTMLCLDCGLMYLDYRMGISARFWKSKVIPTMMRVWDKLLGVWDKLLNRT